MIQAVLMEVIYLVEDPIEVVTKFPHVRLGVRLIPGIY